MNSSKTNKVTPAEKENTLLTPEANIGNAKIKKSGYLDEPTTGRSSMFLGVGTSQGVATSLRNVLGSALFNETGLKEQIQQKNASKSSVLSGQKARKQSESIAFRMKAIYLQLSIFAFVALTTLVLYDIFYSLTHQKISVSHNWYILTCVVIIIKRCFLFSCRMSRLFMEIYWPEFMLWNLVILERVYRLVSFLYSI